MALRRAKRVEPPPPPGPTRVLVVNDEPDALELLVRVLARAGFEVATARDTDELGDHLVEGRPGVIVLDVAAGGIGANLKLLDFVRGFRDPAVAETPVVLVAAVVSAAMFSWQAGIDELLVRPFHADDLVAAVRSAAHRPATDRARYRKEREVEARRGGRPRAVATPPGPLGA